MSEVQEFEAVEENEAHGLDDLLNEAEAGEREQAEAENQPSAADLEKARAFAEKLNAAFLWGTRRVCCPSVENIDEIVDREAGTEALTPLAMELGGEVPEWLAAFMEDYKPYISAGIYMGTTVYMARRVEKAIQAEAEKQAKAQQQAEAEAGQGATNGDQ